MKRLFFSAAATAMFVTGMLAGQALAQTGGSTQADAGLVSALVSKIKASLVGVTTYEGASATIVSATTGSDIKTIAPALQEMCAYAPKNYNEPVTAAICTANGRAQLALAGGSATGGTGTAAGGIPSVPFSTGGYGVPGGGGGSGYPPSNS